MATERICAVCKTDCSTSERVKDKKGRYFHKGCYERARKAALAKQKRAQAGAVQPAPARSPRPAPRAAAAPAAAPAIRSCPNCNGMLQPGAVLCTTCGFNLQTGQLMPMLSAVKFDNAPPKKSGGGVKVGLPSGSMGSLFKNPIVIAACIAGFFGVLFLIALNSDGGKLFYMGAHLILALGVAIWLLVDAFTEGVSHGILCLICGIYSIYYVFGVSTNQNLKIAYCLSLLVMLGGFGLESSMRNSTPPVMFSNPAMMNNPGNVNANVNDDDF